MAALRGLRVAGAAVLIAVALGGAARAQERSPAQRQVLTELAMVMGQSHALRQACDGPTDQVWRGWMMRLLQTEAQDDAFDRRMRESFNTCSRASRAEAARTARRGGDLARAAGAD